MFLFESKEALRENESGRETASAVKKSVEGRSPPSAADPGPADERSLASLS